jgi:molybdopterin-biosynthesis enzyme MoeA-like protein
MKLPIIRKHLEGGAPFLSRAVFTRMEEADLRPLLEKIVGDHPEIMVGSYPTWSDPRYQTKLTFDGKDRQAIERAVAHFLKLLPEGEPQWIE